MSEQDRFVALDGCFNFRDLGDRPTRDGRRVRTGWLFRSDALHHMTPGDVARVRDVLGVRTVVDLRSRIEREAEAPAALCEPPVALHHIPFFDREGRGSGASARVSLGQLYALMLQFARAPIARAVEILAASDTPAVFHCAAGKDRTGVLSAVVLGALDVPDEIVIADYADTRRSLDRIVARLRASSSYGHVFTELPPETLHAEPAAMEELLSHVRTRYGSMRGYLREADVADESVARLAERLLA